MTLRLVVDTDAWDLHVRTVAASIDDLVPVVKGNGYGFGRRALALEACRLAETIAVGTVHELRDVADVAAANETDVVVLTPTLRAPASTDPILTVASERHVAALQDWRGRVIVKLASSIRRYGADDLALVDAARAAGLEVEGVAVHPPLVGDEDHRRSEVTRWLDAVDPALAVWVSHLSPDTYASLPGTHRYRLRLGTALWHGDKSMLRLEAQVLDTRPVPAGTTAGYRQPTVPGAGTLVMVGAGTAHGVHPLPDGRSPFHFARRRLELLEPPHMHTSMVFVPDADTPPDVGDHVDVQRPLTSTWVDVVERR